MKPRVPEIYYEIISIVRKNPWKTFVVVVFHIWVYGLAFHHIAEFKSLMDIFTHFF